MQVHLSNHFLQYEDKDFEESEFAISAWSQTFELYQHFFPHSPFSMENTVSWDMHSLAGAAFLRSLAGIVPPSPTDKINALLSHQREGKACALTSPPVSPVAASPPLHPMEILEMFALAEDHRHRALPSMPVAGPSGVQRSPSPNMTPAPIDPPAKQKRGATKSTTGQQGVHTNSYNCKKLTAIAALEVNPGEPVLQAVSPDNPPIAAHELADLGNHKSVMGSLSINALHLLCCNLRDVCCLEVKAINHAAQLQSCMLELEFCLSKTLQSIIHNFSTADNALAPLFDGDKALR
ncbi:hypothetical protein CVT25_012051 [Psilocybe cyanescens]|uniref:Uncharacterized protein n=1 Tax=Psilocybe cyanescens TaxID=93625 RepID=A0A409XQV4_PSICY|nr:hypothetical protein CVT25_012051 [Psilocybe cyanescens]